MGAKNKRIPEELRSVPENGDLSALHEFLGIVPVDCPVIDPGDPFYDQIVADMVFPGTKKKKK
jgi:hypothetical protein